MSEMVEKARAAAIPEDVMRAAKAACDKHGVSAMDIPFHPSAACFVAMTAIMAERERYAKICAALSEVEG